MQVKKQQLEPDMEQQTGSKLGKEYVKAVYRHPAYLTNMESSVQFSRSVVSDSLQPQGLQHARPPCPSLSSLSQSLLKLMSIESVMPSNLSHPLSSPSPPAPNPSIRVFVVKSRGPAAHSSKAKKETSWSKGKFAFYVGG